MILATIKIGDCEDPVLYAAEPIYKWQNTEAGKWCMEHSVEELTWHTKFDHHTYGYIVQITGKFKPDDELIYRLKFC